MSRFTTKIPVKLDEVIGLFPPKSDVHEVRLSEDNAFVEIEWSNDWLQTPFTVPIEYPLENFWAKQLPEKVTSKLPQPSPAEQGAEKEVDKPKAKSDKRK